jgi:heat shock protein HslJ
MADLKNTKWILTELAGKAVSLPDGAQAFLMMDPDQNRLNGSGGCNDLFADMKLDGSNLSFAGLGATKKMCEGRMDTEQNFLSALRNTSKFELSNSGKLSLLNKGGDVLAKLKKDNP